MTKGVTCVVDLNAVAYNYRLLQSRAPKSEIAGVFKANGYGLGATAIATALNKIGCKNFYVALFDEALKLRAALPAISIAVLGGVPAGAEDEARANNILPVINDLGALSRWQGPALLHVDTGMNRLGLDAREWKKLCDDPSLAAHVPFTHIMSHLSCADEPEHPLNAEQLKKFETIAKHFPQAKRSFANSNGVLLGPAYHFDQCRPGRALYGMATPASTPANLRNAVSLFAPVIMVRSIDSDMPVGYGATQHMRAGTRLATIAAGYADGLLRALSNSDRRQVSHFYIGDHKVPLVGRVSMDLITLDVSHVPEALVHTGARVEIMGPHQSADELAASAGTIGYEMLTNISARVTRKYVPLSEAA